MTHWLTITKCDVCGGDRVQLKNLPKPTQWEKLLLLDTCSCEHSFEPRDQGEQE